MEKNVFLIVGIHEVFRYFKFLLLSVMKKRHNFFLGLDLLEVNGILRCHCSFGICDFFSVIMLIKN